MVGTDPFTRVSVEAKPAWYWPSLLKQSNVKWLAHTHKLTWTAAGMLLLKIKRNHCLFCCSVAGTEYRHWCRFLQPTTEQFVCLSQRHCKTLLSYCWTHRTSPLGWMPPSLISPITAQRRPAYVNDSFLYITKGAESEQPVGAPFY